MMIKVTQTYYEFSEHAKSKHCRSLHPIEERWLSKLSPKSFNWKKRIFEWKKLLMLNILSTSGKKFRQYATTYFSVDSEILHASWKWTKILLVIFRIISKLHWKPSGVKLTSEIWWGFKFTAFDLFLTVESGILAPNFWTVWAVVKNHFYSL